MKRLSDGQIRFIILYLFFEKIQSYMFTIGIFSTHLPYLAFVFFYAYFFIFGIQKANNEELSSNEKTYLTESQTIHTISSQVEHQNFHYYEFLTNLNSKNTQKVQFKKPLKLTCFSQNQIINSYIQVSLLNRPPPSI